MWNGKYKRPDCHQETSGSDPFWSIAFGSQVTDYQNEQDSADVGGADDESWLGAGELVLSLQGRQGDVDDAIDSGTLHETEDTEPQDEPFHVQEEPAPSAKSKTAYISALLVVLYRCKMVDVIKNS